MKGLINVGSKPKYSSKGQQGVIGRREHHDLGDNPSLPKEPADNLDLRSHRDLSLVRADEQGSFGFLLQALGKRTAAESRNLQVRSFSQLIESDGQDFELGELSHTESIWRPNQKANGNREKHSFKKIRIKDVGI